MSKTTELAPGGYPMTPTERPWCFWCGKARAASDWEQEHMVSGWQRCCNVCAGRKLREQAGPFGWLIPLRRVTEARRLRVNHSDLIPVAAKWLQRKGCSVVITEMAGAASEEADAIGWKGACSLLVECKASRSDFLADRKKYFRANPEKGMGYYRWFMAPVGLLRAEEIPDGWGLLEMGAKVRETRKPVAFTEHNQRREKDLLLSALRRVAHNAPKGVSVKCYTYQTTNRATLGIEPLPELGG
jgi:hypothetical protein